MPDTPGVESSRILKLRTVEDALEMRRRVEEEKPERAVVIGGGFIGLEAAENLMEAGVKVTLLQRSEQVLPPLDWDMACELHDHLRRKGLDLRFKHSVESYEEIPGGVRVHVAGRESIDCSFVVLAVGVVPESDLARAAGLELGPKGSIAVDSHMRTSDPRHLRRGRRCARTRPADRQAQAHPAWRARPTNRGASPPTTSAAFPASTAAPSVPRS